MIVTFQLVEKEILELIEATDRPDKYGISLGNTQTRNGYHKFMLLDCIGTLLHQP